MVRVFSVGKPVGNVHEFWYCPRFGSAHFFDEIWMAKPENEGVDLSLIRDVFR
jgi:hypothetical protein